MVTTDAIAAMKIMASEPKKRAALLKDATCVGGLVLVLSNPDNTIVKESLKTLNLLCDSPDGPNTLRNHMGMMDQLDNLIHSECEDLALKGLAESLKNKLCESVEPPHAHAPLKDISNTSRRSSRNSSISSSAKVAKSIVLQLRGLHDKSDTEVCARLLLKIRGVISFTFDLTKKRIILRTKLDVKPETLATTIAKSMTMTAQQVVKNESGEESYVNFNTTDQQPKQLPVCEDYQDLPDYLSDDSDIIVDDKALKKPTKEDEKNSTNWFSMAAGFLTNSFYW